MRRHRSGAGIWQSGLTVSHPPREAWGRPAVLRPLVLLWRDSPHQSWPWCHALGWWVGQCDAQSQLSSPHVSLWFPPVGSRYWPAPWPIGVWVSLWWTQLVREGSLPYGSSAGHRSVGLKRMGGEEKVLFVWEIAFLFQFLQGCRDRGFHFGGR